MAQQWYIYRNGQQSGPFTREQLNEQAGDGRLKPEDMIWTEGMPNWTRADQVEGLISAAPPQTSSPVATPSPPAAPPPAGMPPYQGGSANSRGTPHPPPRQYKKSSPGTSPGSQGKGLLVVLILLLVGIGALGGYLFLILGENGDSDAASDQDPAATEAVDEELNPLVGKWAFVDPMFIGEGIGYFGIYPDEFILGADSEDEGSMYFRIGGTLLSFDNLTLEQQDEAMFFFGDDIDDSFYFLIVTREAASSIEGVEEDDWVLDQDWALMDEFCFRLLPNGQANLVDRSLGEVTLYSIEEEEFQTFMNTAEEASFF